MKNDKIKRIVSISAAAVCMLSALRLVPLTEDQASAAGEMSAFQITENMEIGWNIGNTLDATSSSSNPGLSTETAWGNPKVTQELINAVKAKGFNTIRIPTTWYQHLDSENNIDEAWLERVKEVVDYAYNQDMYVILNLHHEEWINRSDFATAYDEMSPKLIKIWEQIASCFADYDQRLIFEGMNEPRAVDLSYEWTGTQAEYEVVNKLNADFVKTVRGIDSPYKDTRLLMIPSYCASAYDYVYKYMEIPDDDYIAVSLHAYAPYEFTMADTTTDYKYNHEEFTDAYKAQLDSLFGNMRTYFTDKDIPVVLGEFSASNYNNTEARCEWAEYYVSSAKKFGIPCVLWDNNIISNSAQPNEVHGYINRTTLEWYEESEPVIDAMMSVINDDSIVWGSERKLPVYTHPDIDSGKTLYSDSVGQTIDDSIAGGNCSANYAVTLSSLEGKDVAIKFTGDTPILAFMDSSWDNWTEVNAYEVDSENGIAYYSYESISKASSASTQLSYLTSRTPGKTTITQISIIDASDVQQPSTDVPDTSAPTTEAPTFEVKKYTVDISEASRTSLLFLEFEGTPGAYTNGCAGYTVGEDWTAIEWETTLDSDGTAKVSIDLAEIPESVDSLEIQIWWAATYDAATDTNIIGENELVNYEIHDQDDEVLYGDADLSGDLGIADVVKVMCYSSNKEKYPMTEEQLDAADVYQRGDGVSALDALAIQKRITQVITSLPESWLMTLN